MKAVRVIAFNVLLGATLVALLELFASFFVELPTKTCPPLGESITAGLQIRISLTMNGLSSTQIFRKHIFTSITRKVG